MNPFSTLCLAGLALGLPLAAQSDLGGPDNDTPPPFDSTPAQLVEPTLEQPAETAPADEPETIPADEPGTTPADEPETDGPPIEEVEPPEEQEVAAEEAATTPIFESEGGFIIKEAALNDIFQFLAKEGGRQYFHNA
jgi:hypothetical protein